MAQNKVQFQKGMCIAEFLTAFGDEAKCSAAVVAARWPDGFRCPRCDSPDHYIVGHGARKLFQCNQCRHQTSVTAGSMMEHSKLPLTKWFLAMYLISQAKTGLSALALKRHLGVSYPTAWLLHHKINLSMAAQDDTERLGGYVQLDDAYLGGERTGGKVGRGSENKVPFVAAVSLSDQGHPLRVKLNLVAGFTNEAISSWAKACLLPQCTVLSDGLGCFAAVTDAGCVHTPRVVGALKPKDLPEFKWVNTILGNLKTTLAGAFHALKFRKYAQQYLSAFAYRFNRRFDLRDLVAQVIVNGSRSQPATQKHVRGNAEATC